MLSLYLIAKRQYANLPLMTLKIAITIVFASILTVATTGQSSWLTFYAEPDSSFKVEVPATMSKSEKAVTTELGELVTIAYTLEGGEDDQNKLFMINEVRYPDGTFPADSIELQNEYLTAAIETAARTISGEVLYQHPLDKDSYTGFLFRIKYNEGNAVMKGYSLLYKDRFYMVKVYAHTNDSLNDEMKFFLESFEPLD